MGSAHVPVSSVAYSSRTVLQLDICLGESEIRRNDSYSLVLRFGIESRIDCFLNGVELGNNKIGIGRTTAEYLLVRFLVQTALNCEPDLFHPNRRSSSKFEFFLDRTESPVRGSQKFGLNQTEPDFGIPTQAFLLDGSCCLFHRHSQPYPLPTTS